MVRAILLCLLLAFVVPVFAVPARAVAADGKILDDTISRYQEEAARWEPRIKAAAKSVFWILATINLVYTFAFLFIRGNTSIGDFFGEFLKYTLSTGFFYWLLENGSEIAKSILTSFAQLGREASTSYQEELSPSNLLGFALDLVVRACGSFGEQDIATSVIALLLSIAIAVMFSIIAAMMALLLCSAWVLVYAGVIYLGFGGGNWFRDMAINYYKTVIGLAVQTFSFCLLVGIGQQQIERLLTDANQVKNVVVKGYVYNSTINTTSLTITEGCIILLFTVVLFMLVKTVPQMVAGVVTGSSAGGIHLGSAGGAVGAAAAMATGGAMMAAQAGGAVMALSSAYQQTSTNMSEGMGKFIGAAMPGGLKSALSNGKGMAFARDMASNLISGACDAAGEKMQKTTAGGKIAAQVDNNNATNIAKNDAKKEEAAKKAAETAAASGSSGTSSDSGGGETAAGTGNDGQAAGSAMATSKSAGVDGSSDSAETDDGSFDIGGGFMAGSASPNQSYASSAEQAESGPQSSTANSSGSGSSGGSVLGRVGENLDKNFSFGQSDRGASSQSSSGGSILGKVGANLDKTFGPSKSNLAAANMQDSTSRSGGSILGKVGEKLDQNFSVLNYDKSKIGLPDEK